jgi:hypothetical protein
MASKLLKLRTLSTMALICRRSPFAFIIPSTATTTATRASPSVTSVRCLVTADSPVSKPVVTASPLERLRQRQMRDAAKAAARIQPAVKDTTKEAPQLPLSFQGLGLDPELMMAVKELGLAEPTEVQALGIPAVVAGESVVIASHTGSGKTLAYMLPIVQVCTLALRIQALILVSSAGLRKIRHSWDSPCHEFPHFEHGPPVNGNHSNDLRVCQNLTSEMGRTCLEMPCTDFCLSKNQKNFK